MIVPGNGCVPPEGYNPRIGRHINAEVPVAKTETKLDGILILAAGEGSRMAPFSEQVPKPFFNIDGKPLIQHVIDYAHKHFRTVVPTVVSAQSKHLHWFDKIEGISSIILNNTASNYYPVLHLTGRWIVLCADLLLNMDVDWSQVVEEWVASGRAAAVCPIPKPSHFARKGDQVTVHEPLRIPGVVSGELDSSLGQQWEFVDQGKYILSGISFINTSHNQVEGVHYGGFSESWKMLHQINQLDFLPITGDDWHTFDTIREIADYEDEKLKQLCNEIHTDIEATLRGYLGGPLTDHQRDEIKRWTGERLRSFGNVKLEYQL